MLTRLCAPHLVRESAGALALVLATVAAGCSSRPAPVVKSAGVLALPEYYAHSIAALGFPGMRRAFQVGHGSQLGAGDGAFEWRLDSDTPVTVSPVYFEADGVPVAHWWMVSARDSVHFEAAALAVPGATDTLLVASVRATVLTRAGAPSATPLLLVVRDELAGPHFRPWDAEPAGDAPWRWRDGMALRADRVVGAFVGAAKWQARPGASEGARLEAGSRPAIHVLECWLADRPIARAEATKIAARLEHDAHVARARAAWRLWLARAAPLSTPDSLVNQAYRAALVTLLQGHERSGEGWVPMGNPFQYRDTWLRDGARVVRALAIAGYTDLARADALTLGRYELPSGALLSQPGQARWRRRGALGVRAGGRHATERGMVEALPAGRRARRGLACPAARAHREHLPHDSRGLAGPAALRRPAGRRTRARPARGQ